jgi:hypothetical protein
MDRVIKELSAQSQMSGDDQQESCEMSSLDSSYERSIRANNKSVEGRRKLQQQVKKLK